MKDVWVLFSTSSPQAGVGFFTADGECLYAREALTPMASGGFCLSGYEDGIRSLGDVHVRGFAADRGPGSFTGTRVAVMLAKTLAWYQELLVAGVSAFELIGSNQPTTIPNRKGEAFLKLPGGDATLVRELPRDVRGYGPMVEEQNFPSVSAYRFSPERCTWIAPELLVPEYLVQPSISVPKKPLTAKST